MIPKLSYFHIARFVLEAKTAVSINSGISDGAFDTLIVKDANNLPAIPGTSLAGVLRHNLRSALAETDQAEASVKRIFGYVEQNSDKTAISRLHVSWGCIHDSTNTPVEGLVLDQRRIKNDPLLKFLSQEHAMHRERVKISEKGVAEDGAKFDITIIPAGCRFSFEISYWSDTDEEKKQDSDWKQILSLIQQPLYIGASTRSGLGLFECNELHSGSFNLGDNSQQDSYQADYQRYQKLGFALNDYTQLAKSESPKQEELEEQRIVAKISLRAEDFWRFGQAGEPLKASGKSPDATPLLEPVIDWERNPANFSPRHIVIPGSSVKGALNHRVKYHLNRLIENYRDADNYKKLSESENLLFGSERQDKNGEESGQAGLIFISDLYIKYDPREHKVVHLTHNSLDRYTGGVRDKALYMEELLWRMDKPFTLRLVIDKARFKLIEQSSEQKSTGHKIPLHKYKQALKLTLDDLVQGRLALGAGSSKGHGYFEGDISWSKAGKKWLKDGLVQTGQTAGQTKQTEGVK